MHMSYLFQFIVSFFTDCFWEDDDIEQEITCR